MRKDMALESKNLRNDGDITCNSSHLDLPILV